MDNRGAQFGGLAEAPVTIADSVEGIIKQVCLIRIVLYLNGHANPISIFVPEDQLLNKSHNIWEIRAVQWWSFALVIATR
jgi:hypothetical protein